VHLGIGSRDWARVQSQQGQEQDPGAASACLAMYTTAEDRTCRFHDECQRNNCCQHHCDAGRWRSSRCTASKQAFARRRPAGRCHDSVLYCYQVDSLRLGLQAYGSELVREIMT
jgi:hypothetical protein